MGGTPWNRATPSHVCQDFLGRLFLPGLLLVGLIFFGNCARAPKPVPDLPPDHDVPVATIPDEGTVIAPAIPGEGEIDSQPADPSESDLRILQNVAEAHPDPLVSLETQMALARTYEASGDQEAALHIYREVAKQAPADSPKHLKEQALERLSVLENSIVDVSIAESPVAVLVPASRLPPRAQWASWLTDLQRAEVTVLVVEVGTKLSAGRRSATSSSRKARRSKSSPGVYFQTKWAPVKQPVLKHIIALAHEKGIAVYAAVTLRRMPWLEKKIRWADWVYRLERNQLRRSKALDMFHPDVQKYHIRFLTDLVKTGLDGLLFRGDAPMGPFDGLTRFGLAGFRQQYGIELNARILFPPHPTKKGKRRNQGSTLSKSGSSPGGTSQANSSPVNTKVPSVVSRFSPAYWKWAGWKAREQLQIIGRYLNRVRQFAPRLDVAMEVHREAISHPIAALLRYSEDVAEARQMGVQYLVTPMGLSGPGPDRLVELSEEESSRAAVPFMTQALEGVEGPENLWVMRPVPEGNMATIGQTIPVRRDQLTLPKGVGLLYTLDTPALP